MRNLRVLGAFVSLAGCGGSVAAVPDLGAAPYFPPDGSGSFAADSADSGDAPTLGTGPVDASGAPTTLVMMCDGAVPTVSLKLPCLLGGDLFGPTGPGYHVLECQLLGAPDSPSPTDVAISLAVLLPKLSMSLHQPVTLPFDGIPPPPPSSGGGGQIVGYPGERFVGSLTGTAVFSAVDPVARAFIGRIQQAKVDWQGDRGDMLSCTVVDRAFWAVPGGFI